MRYLTGIMFEPWPECNLSGSHHWCPNSSAARFANTQKDRHLDDKTIASLAECAWNAFDFRGLFGFHYYNEPLLYPSKLLELVELIRERIPESRFTLWTNGTQIHSGMKHLLSLFSDVVVTDYDGLDKEKILGICDNIRFNRFNPDARLYLASEESHQLPCVRPMTELIIDYYGKMHFCCYDWRGTCDLPNVLVDDPVECFSVWQSVRDRIVSGRDNMPEFCKHCAFSEASLQSHDANLTSRCEQYASSVKGE